MSELEELELELRIAIKYKFDHNEIIHLENLIKQKKVKKENDKNYSLDNINYPYGLHLV